MVIPVALIVCACSADVMTPAERLQAAGERAGLLLGDVARAEAEMRFGDALVLADSLVKIAPDLPQAHFRRGQMQLKLYRLDSADASYARAATLDPYHRGAWYQRGHVSFERGQYREAVKRYHRQREVILNSPKKLKDFYGGTDDNAIEQTWLQVGRSYQLLHRPDSAAMAFERVLERDSMHAQANAWLADLHDEQGQTADALILAQRAMRADTRNPDFVYKVGVLLFKSGELGAAVEVLQKALAAQPWNAGVHYNLGRALIATGRTEEGQWHLQQTDVLQDLDQEIDQARAGAARFPNDPARWRAVADLLGRAGRRAEQREALSIARSVARRTQPGAQNDITGTQR